MRKPLALVAAVLLATSLAAGCGGDDSGDDDASTEVSGGAAGDETTTTAADGDTTTTAAGEGTDDAPPEGANPDSEYCQASQTFASDPVLQNIDFQDPEQAAHAIDLLTAMHDAAPADLQDDIQTVIDGFTAVAAALREAGDDPTAQQQALADLQGQFEDLSTASANVETFTRSECGIDVNGETGAGDTGDTGTDG